MAKKIEELKPRDPMEGSPAEVFKEINDRLTLLWFKMNEVIEELNKLPER